MRRLTKPSRILPGTPSLIYRDAAVRELLDRLVKEPLTIASMRLKIRDELGADRTPCRSSIGRYAQRARLGLGFKPQAQWGGE